MKPPYAVFWVYLLTCSASGKRYVGITRFTPRRRWRRHVARALANKKRNGDCPALHRAIRAYGEDAFTQEVICVALTWEGACDAERTLIAELGTKWPGGYNLTDGGDGVLGREVGEAERKRLGSLNRGRTLTPEHRAKIGEAHKGKKLSEETKAKMRGKLRSPEQRAKMGAAHRGKKLTAAHIEAMRVASTGRTHTPETREKMSAWQIGKQHSDETKARIGAKATGRKHTEEHREANRQAQTGRRMSEETLERMRASKAAKSTAICCCQTGERFASISHASKMLGVWPSHLRRHLQGSVATVKGLTFEVAT